MAGERKPVSVVRDTTAEAVAAAREMIGAARHGALATISSADGWPVATRVGLALLDGVPLILVSALAAHTGALRADSRCALLIGEPGKGDPLAHPRIMLKCRAREIGRDNPEYGAARVAYLAAQPKARLYVDLPDFAFMLLEPDSASFNAGFGKAYALTADEVRGS